MLVDLEETVINIEKGRHPVIPLLFSADDQFVANDTKLKVGHNFSEFEVFLYLKHDNFVKLLLGFWHVFRKVAKILCRLMHEL
jgi:hypothetical protein